jgi:hypothetical protein
MCISILQSSRLYFIKFIKNLIVYSLVFESVRFGPSIVRFSSAACAQSSAYIF